MKRESFPSSISHRILYKKAYWGAFKLPVYKAFTKSSLKNYSNFSNGIMCIFLYKLQFVIAFIELKVIKYSSQS